MEDFNVDENSKQAIEIEEQLNKKIFKGVERGDTESILNDFGANYSYISKKLMPSTRTVDNEIHPIPEYVCGVITGTIYLNQKNTPDISIKVYITCENKVEYMKLEKLYTWL